MDLSCVRGNSICQITVLLRYASRTKSLQAFRLYKPRPMTAGTFHLYMYIDHKTYMCMDTYMDDMDNEDTYMDKTYRDMYMSRHHTSHLSAAEIGHRSCQSRFTSYPVTDWVCV